MTYGSLFSGIGGFEIAAKAMGWDAAFLCEYEDFPRKILSYYFPKTPLHHDIKETDFSIYRGKIDIIFGGFPCQPFSHAGKRAGVNDNRHLWPEMLRAIREVQPPWVIGENVAGILSMEQSEVFTRVDSRKCSRNTNHDLFEKVYTRQTAMLLAGIIKDLEEEGYAVQPFDLPAAGVGAPHRRSRIWITAFNEKYQR